ncbi:MAG TPA: MG2 domain-containing protein, partial [Actinomycetes bacterium]|nr:MG2 domain-containing protein [Actinomycetes bacterium]
TFACEGKALTFTPDENLAFDTPYLARVNAGVQSAAGGQGSREPYEWRFTTVPLPRILGTTPYDGEQDARPTTAFVITFNAPIDADTVMPNLEMTPPLSPTQVYTYFNTWDNTFVLNFGARPSTDYEVRIGPDIADPYGNTTGQEMTVRFRTAPLSPRVQIPMPGMLGTLDAHQPARVVAGFLNTDRLDLSLYRLSLDELLRAQRDWWEYNPPGSPARQWSVPVEAPLNEIAYTPVDLAEGGGALAPGIYLLELHAPGVEYEHWAHRRLLTVSAYNLTLKTTRDEIWAWATDLATGRPAGGLTLAARDDDGAGLGTATTDTDGVARFSFDTPTYGTLYVAAQEPFVLGGSGWDWMAGISPWDFGLEEAYEQRPYRAHLYTDRPIYRPGQAVYFRGILRAEDDVRYSLPGARSVQVVVHSADGEQLYEENLTLDEFGAFHGELTLAEGAALGDYGINARLGDEAFSTSFSVAAYRPPEFEVLVTPEEAELSAGKTTSADVEVRYFFGGPVAGAPVDWNVLTAAYRFEPAQFGRYDFTDEDDPWVCRWCWWWEPPAPEVVLSGSGTTGADGRLAIALPTGVMTGGQRLTVEASAYGKDGQAISGRSGVVVHTGEFYIGLAPQQAVGKAGEELAVDVVTVDWAGTRLPGQALDVEVYRREWVNTFVENELGGGTWEWETVDTLVLTGTLTTDADAEGVAAFVAQQGGSYRVVVSGRDRRERSVASSTWVWVSGDEYVSWRRENNDRITLISDKSTYVPGETAEILIPSPFAGEQWAWVTVERGGVLHQEVLRLKSNSVVYRLPITAGHAPNVYVSAVIVKGPDAPTPPAPLPGGEESGKPIPPPPSGGEGSGEPVATHKVGYVVLTVEPVAQELNVALTPSVEQAEPGETVSFDLRATDASGEPVEGAFSLDLVDKAVLSLKPRTPDAILEAFYGRRGLGVSTASGLAISINRLLVEQMEEMAEQAADESRALGLGGG